MGGWSVVDSLSCGKAVADDRRCEVRFRVLQKGDGSIGKVLGGGGFAFLREGRGLVLCQDLVQVKMRN